MAKGEFIDDVVLMECPVCNREIKALVAFEPSKRPVALDLPDGETLKPGDTIKYASFDVKPVNVRVDHNCRGTSTPITRN